MVEVRALLLTEGSSDAALAPHLEWLCVSAGAHEASVRWPDLRALPSPPGRAVHHKLPTALGLHPDTNLLFIHLDADEPDPEPRRRLIEAAVATLAGPPHAVPVVPVQELEAWLLTSEEEIRAVAGARSSTSPLGLPKVPRIEATARPKEILQNAISAAWSGGRRRRPDLARVRHRLIERLDLDGRVRELPSFARLVVDIEQAIGALAANP